MVVGRLCSNCHFILYTFSSSSFSSFWVRFQFSVTLVDQHFIIASHTFYEIFFLYETIFFCILTGNHKVDVLLLKSPFIHTQGKLMDYRIDFQLLLHCMYVCLSFPLFSLGLWNTLGLNCKSYRFHRKQYFVFCIRRRKIFALVSEGIDRLKPFSFDWPFFSIWFIQSFFVRFPSRWSTLGQIDN